MPGVQKIGKVLAMIKGRTKALDSMDHNSGFAFQKHAFSLDLKPQMSARIAGISIR